MAVAKTENSARTHYCSLAENQRAVRFERARELRAVRFEKTRREPGSERAKLLRAVLAVRLRRLTREKN